MRVIVGLLVAACLIGAALKYRMGEPAPAPTATAAQKTATAPQEPSQHNWPKRSLDRAGDVKRQVAAQRKEEGGR